ncbi:hypothetical protein [Plantactinospora sp. WMMB782]|uniref:hypothetical protein n=1 Tax=Plantactinospora sp. WMMB782 TaxID=3404121 RepID=UPI003B923718
MFGHAEHSHAAEIVGAERSITSLAELASIVRAASSALGRSPNPHAIWANAAQLLEGNAKAYVGSEEQLIAGIQPSHHGPEAWSPAFIDSIVQTLRRARDLRALAACISDSPCPAAFICGSMSYGPFYRVRTKTDGSASDVDLLLVTRSMSDVTRILLDISSLYFLSPTDLEQAIDAATMAAKYAEVPDYEFHTKVRCWRTVADAAIEHTPGIAPAYALSLHFVTPIGLRSATRIGSAPFVSIRCGVPDGFRTGGHTMNIAVSFTGSPLVNSRQISPWRLGLYREEHQPLAVVGDSLYIGRFASRLSPCTDILWTDRAVEDVLNRFQRRISERLQAERSLPIRQPRFVWLAHPRSRRFAPHVVRRLRSLDAIELQRSAFAAPR